MNTDMEHAIGTRITLEVVEVEARNGCNGCVFDRGIDCQKPVEWYCGETNRKDHKYIIYKKVKEENNGNN